MAIVRWDPVREVDAATGEAARLFDAFFGNGGSARRRWVPAMDLLEREDHFLVRADLPGLSQEDIELEVANSVLTISGERKAEETRESDGYYRVERSFGSFQRSLTLPEGVNLDDISAGFDRGVLEIRVPKPEEQRPRRIEIGAGTVEGHATAK